MKLSQITNSLLGFTKGSESSISQVNSSLIKENNKTNRYPNQASFSEVLKNSMEELNQTQLEAYDAMNDMATGKVENLQEAVQKIEEAELSLKLGLEFKNKALGAYKQVMSMQI